MLAFWNDIGNFDSYGPYFLTFLIAFSVSWFDIHKVCEDVVSYSTNPLFSRESFVFIVLNGLAASALYGYASQSKSGIAIALTWNQQDAWIRALTVGISAIVIIRSRILPLKDNKSLGLDVIYIRWRDKGVQAVCTDTIAKRKAISRDFSNKFVDDPHFIEDFSEIVLHILSQHRQTERIKTEQLQIDNVIKLRENNSSLESIGIVQGTLIRSAVTFGNMHYIERILLRRERFKTFAPRGWSALFDHFVR